MSGGGALDPLLAPALELEQRAVVPGRTWADVEAEVLTRVIERLAGKVAAESDTKSAGQLMNACEALGVITISLVAYARGVVPRVGEQKPNVNLILPS